jgi:GNAT superfamily N-acetyltransferase
MSLRFEYALRVPSLEEFRSICTAVGWDEVINFAAAPLSLIRSLFGVTVLDQGLVVGMGRVIGDGALYFYIQDIAVRPDYQGMGIGRGIMDRIMDWLCDHAPEHAFVGLFASEGRDSFYAHYGFMRHPALTGMFYVVPVRAAFAEMA